MAEMDVNVAARSWSVTVWLGGETFGDAVLMLNLGTVAMVHVLG
ncbi:MAG: hypothetical protein ACRDQZ_10040 [Mycobacteriales bacterium]